MKRIMTKRLNIILPEETVRVLDRVSSKGDRSRLIDQAVLHYVRSRSRDNLRERLKEGYLANAKDDLKMAQEWFPLEEEAWQIANKRGKRK
jgi:metal-responsive CopG/Arc/MetJ family transcriptional regulator